ncbi:hypothetical protein C8Q77DRAFT_1067569 [Trametes polyzona]|nr:hypothetical protein C8Q77DRAFT_1067569 [Trametes polyzona]
MPGHHRVRFADIPATPSSTFSGASLASSPGPATPPSLLATPLPSKHSNSPSPYYATLPLPGTVQVHPVLACTPDLGAPLSWDLTQPVESVLVRTATALRPLSAQVAMEPATMPKLASITIICAQLPWSITVVPRQDAPWAAPYVTVGDVLYTLYRTLRLGVTQAELGMCEAKHHELVRDAYVARYGRVAHPAARALEKTKGIKRVDFLCCAQLFKGLSLVPEGNRAKGLAPGMVWELHVARP